MARIVYSALVTDIRGRLNGSVFSVWKGIHYIRKMASIVTNPQTEHQQKMRSVFQHSAGEWSKLTPSERALWEDYAEHLRLPDTSDETVGGETIIPALGRIQSGFNAYISVNQLLASVGFPSVRIPPLTIDAPPMPHTNIAQFGSYSPPLKFEIWIPTPYPVEVKAQIWVMLRKKGAHSHIIKVSDAPALPILPAEVEIDSIRAQNSSVPLATFIRPFDMFLQCRVVAKNGRVSLPGVLYKIRII